LAQVAKDEADELACKPESECPQIQRTARASRRDSINIVIEIRDAQPGDAHAIAAVHVESSQPPTTVFWLTGVLANLSIPDRERTWSKILLTRRRGQQFCWATSLR
jgi:hypothetical protein